MDAYVTRLCWNENGWERPSGSAIKFEEGTFISKHNFGFEEWLYSPIISINNMRYGFVQGVNKSQKRLNGHNIKIYLFTIASNKKRYLIGEISLCRVLSQFEADDVYEVMVNNGVIGTMINDVKNVNGDPGFISRVPSMERKGLEIFNIMFNPNDIKRYGSLVDVPSTSIIWKYNRYQLIGASEERINHWLNIIGEA